MRGTDGRIALDPTGRAAGRGAYLCRDAACWDTAGRKRALEHALGGPLPGDLTASLAAGPEALGVSAPTHESTTEPATSAIGAQLPAVEGGAEPRSERASGPVSEERTRQRPNAARSTPTNQSEASAIGAQPTAVEGGAEPRSERASGPVSEERTRQRPNAVGSAPTNQSESQTFEGGSFGKE